MTSFEPIYKPTARRPIGPHARLSASFKDQFTVPTLFLFGSVIQILLSLLLPARLAFAPAILVFLYAFLPTVYTILNPSANPYCTTSIGKKTTALLPNSPGVVVLHLGVRFNHPLGIVAPGGKEIGRFIFGLNDLLHKNAHEYDFLGVESYRGEARAAKNTLLSVYYFSNLASLRRFAHGPLHSESVAWWAAQSRAVRHIGIYHEVFYARRGEWETVYGNLAPMLLGSTHVPMEDGSFQSPLMDGEHHQLRTMRGRMTNGEESE